MTKYEDVKPTEGSIANTFEYIFDINTGTFDAPVWTNVPDITALNPQFTPKLKDIATYAHKGSSAQAKTGNDFVLDFNIMKIRDNTGEFQAEWLKLKAASDALGAANNIGFRFYDALGASDAYQGVAAVSRGNRPDTSNDGVAYDQFVLTGNGQVKPIANPVKAPGSGD
ncbi:phage tail tube protein [Mycetocola saprophilus]|uniref:phage tail tube protein n=1 Tax=Mycetocola saprophilus TaxID=76636 RepID=UPI00068F3AAF|nr:hypothetical protein [Mycetocola saprophilus]